MEQVFSENLIRLRKARGFRTQEAMAEAAGIPFRTYQDIERGTTWPQRRNIDAIAEALKVDPVTLFADSSAMPEPSNEELIRLLETRLNGNGHPAADPLAGLSATARSIVALLGDIHDEAELQALLMRAKVAASGVSTVELPDLQDKVRKRK